MPARTGSKNKKSQAAKQNTKEHFAQMLTDAAEDALWTRFLASSDENVALKTFLRAVEYKRGKPVQPIEGGGEDAAPIRVLIEHIGGNGTKSSASA